MQAVVGLSGLSGFRAALTAGPNVLDSFNRANSALTLGNADSGQAWTANAGTWGIDSNRAYCVADSGSGLNIATVPAAADGTLQVTLPVVSGGSGGDSWLVLRYQDINNFLYVVFSSSDPARLMKRQTGVYSTIDFGEGVPVSAGTVGKVILLGSSIRVFADSEQFINTTSTFLQSATRVGIGTNFGAGPGSPARFDGFSFTP